MICIKANVLRGARAVAELRQQDMADEMGISRETYRKKESGVVYFTDEQKLQLVEILDLTTYQFDDVFYDGKLLKTLEEVQKRKDD